MSTSGGKELRRVDCCVTTFLRPRGVERLVLSIGAHLPDAVVHIADQNEDLDRCFYDELASRSGLRVAPEIHNLDFDCGVSAARNHLMTATPREYKLILEDDLVFIDKTDVALLVRLLDAHPHAGVAAGGVVCADEQVAAPRFKFERETEGTLRQRLDRRPFCEWRGIRVATAHMVPNFALMRRDLHHHVQWDPELKTFEHADFYLRMLATPYSAMVTPDVAIGHLPTGDRTDFQSFRGRLSYVDKAMRKHALNRVLLGRWMVERSATGTTVWSSAK